jgi:hypothetical protein
MALSDRERQCIEALCTYLSSQRGDTWHIADESLDAKYPNERSPEAIISNGDVRAAVEVKSLLWPKGQERFFRSVISLRRSLMPSIPGQYQLVPPNGWDPPWERWFKRRLQAELERVSHALATGERSYVRVPRRGSLHKAASAGSHIWCSHGTVVLPRNSVIGSYYLKDLGPSHGLETQEAKEEFLNAVLTGVQRIENGENDVQVEWREEWRFCRLTDDGCAVEVVATTPAFSIHAAVYETLQAMTAAANGKFARRWADRHAAILDNRLFAADREMLESAFRELDSEDYAEIDDVYLFHEGVIEPTFSRSQGSS